MKQQALNSLELHVNQMNWNQCRNFNSIIFYHKIIPVAKHKKNCRKHRETNSKKKCPTIVPNLSLFALRL